MTLLQEEAKRLREENDHTITLEDGTVLPLRTAYDELVARTTKAEVRICLIICAAA